MDEHLAASHRALGKRRFQWPSFLTAGIGASFFGFSLELFGFELPLGPSCGFGLNSASWSRSSPMLVSVRTSIVELTSIFLAPSAFSSVFAVFAPGSTTGIGSGSFRSRTRVPAMPVQHGDRGDQSLGRWGECGRGHGVPSLGGRDGEDF